MGEALGMIETRGLIAMIEASDAMVKAAKVTLVGWEKPVRLRYSYGARRCRRRERATDAGAAAARRGSGGRACGIPRPHQSLEEVLPIGKSAVGAESRHCSAPSRVRREVRTAPIDCAIRLRCGRGDRRSLQKSINVLGGSLLNDSRP
jgi:microcompartment protein CcmL/EutN